jgi:hypothetical protein
MRKLLIVNWSDRLITSKEQFVYAFPEPPLRFIGTCRNCGSIKRSGSTSPLVGEGESELVEIPLNLLKHGRLFV